MAKLTFDIAVVRRLAAHALAAPAWGKGYGETKSEPCLIFVKDDGVYVMSNGNPGIMADGGETDESERAKGKDQRQLVAYARGYDPSKDGDVWNRCRDAVGGDDFAEYLPIRGNLEKWLADPKAKAFTISCSGERLSYGVDLEKASAAERVSQNEANLVKWVESVLAEMRAKPEVWNSMPALRSQILRVRNRLKGMRNPVGKEGFVRLAAAISARLAELGDTDPEVSNGSLISPASGGMPATKGKAEGKRAARPSKQALPEGLGGTAANARRWVAQEWGKVEKSAAALRSRIQSEDAVIRFAEEARASCPKGIPLGHSHSLAAHLQLRGLCEQALAQLEASNAIRH